MGEIGVSVTSSADALGRIKKAIYPLTSRVIARGWVAEGTVGGGPLRVLFVHACQFNRVLQRRTFGDAAVSAERHVLLLQLPRIVRRNTFGVDLVCAVLPTAYGALLGGIPAYRTREEVRQVIATGGSWDELRKRFSKKRRQISNDFEAKNGLSFRISRERADLELFYHRMYAPHIRRRYGELADVDPYPEVEEAFSRGMLLFVLSGGAPVAGALSIVEGDRLLFRRTGVLDGDESHVKAGAQTALYYFQLRHALERGLSALDTMKSAPFLNDGVFRHKADWGALPHPDDEGDRAVFLFPLGSQDALARFFEANPMIVDDGDGLSAVVGDTTGDPAASAQALAARYPVAGLRKLELLTPGGREVLALGESGAGA